MVKRAIATVINYEKDRLKNHWRVNVIVIKKLENKQEKRKSMTESTLNNDLLSISLIPYPLPMLIPWVAVNS